MRRWKCTLLSLSLSAIMFAGCGNSNSSFVVTNPDQPGTFTEAEVLLSAALDNPRPALTVVAIDHLDPLVQPTPKPNLPGQRGAHFLSVAELETNYETIFGSLSQELGVTLQTQQNVDNIAYIKQQDGTGHFDLTAQPILNNPLGVTGVAFEKITYQTTVPLPHGDRTFSVSGGLLYPTGIDKTQLKGVVVYFHGTTFSKAGVGSNFSDPETQLCAQVLGSQGYAVLIPDYVGQGDDWQNVHPYVLYPEVSAQTAADMLTAVKGDLSHIYGLTGADPAVKVFSAGYSEGGAYSLWFNSYLKSHPAKLDPFYVLTHSVGMEGAYSTSQVIYDYLFDDVSPRGTNPCNVQSQLIVNFVKPALSADAFLSYLTYSLAPGSDPGAVFNLDFYNMIASPPVPPTRTEVGGQSLDMAAAFALPDTSIAGQLVFSGLNKKSNQSTYPGVATLSVSSKNSVKSLVSEAILEPAPLAQLTETLKTADVDLSACDDDGVSIITLDQDSVVVSNNFEVLSAAFPEKLLNAIVVDHQALMVTSPYSKTTPSWAPIDHLGGPPYQLLYALNIFNGF